MSKTMLEYKLDENIAGNQMNGVDEKSHNPLNNIYIFGFK